MKKFIPFLILVLCASGTFAQKTYWNCLSLEVDDEEDLIEAMDQFMATPSGKTMPMTTLSRFANVNTTIPASHQLCLITPDPAVFDNLQQKFNNPSAQVLGMVWDEEVDVLANILGSPLIFAPSNLANTYSNVWSTNVSDPVAFGAAFTAFTKSFPGMALELHEAIAGAENHVTHYIVARSSSLSSWLKNRDTIIASKAFADYMAAARGKADVISSVSLRVVKAYNAPE